MNFYLRKKTVDPDANIDVSHLAKVTISFSGADIENLVNLAALNAAREEANFITTLHLNEAYSEIALGIKRGLELNDEEKEIIAYRECAKALMCYYNPKARKIHAATIIPRGESLGSSNLINPSEYSQSKAHILADIDTCVSGSVCDEIIFGRDLVTLRMIIYFFHIFMFFNPFSIFQHR